MAQAAGRAGFPRAVRLMSPVDFARVFAVRRSAASGALVLYACPAGSATQPARIGLSVSRRIGNAVVRNRWKRVLRETFRGIRRDLPAANDFILVVRSGAAPSGTAGQRRAGESILALAARVVGRPGYGQPPSPAADQAAPRRRR